MKFRIPDKEDYRLTIPSIHLWMKDGYCPLVAKALDFDDMHARMQTWREIEVTDYIYMVVVSNVLTDIGFKLDAGNYCTYKKSIYGDHLPHEDLCVDVHFYDGTSSDLKDDYENYRKRITLFPFDERLYLLPYMFKAVEANVMVRGKLENRHLVVDVPEHWRRLEKLGLIEPNILRNCLRVLKGPAIYVSQ